MKKNCPESCEKSGYEAPDEPSAEVKPKKKKRKKKKAGTGNKDEV